MESNYNTRVRKVLINTALITFVSIITYLLYSTIEKNKIISEKNQKILVDSMTIVAKVKELNALKVAYENLEMSRDSIGLTNDSLIAMVSTLNSYLQQFQYKDSINASKIEVLNSVLLSAKKKLVVEKKELTLLEKTTEVEVVKHTSKSKLVSHVYDQGEHIEINVGDLWLEPIGKTGKILPENQHTHSLIKHIRLKFSILKNNLTHATQKIFTIQLIEPDGNLYRFNPDQDYIKIDGQKVHLTNRKKIEFDGNDTQISFLYPKCTPFKQGKNTVQLYYENKLVAEKSIEIR